MPLWSHHSLRWVGSKMCSQAVVTVDFRYLLSLSSPPIAVFLARERLQGREWSRGNSVEFDVVTLSDSMGWEVALVKRDLRQLQWDQRLQRGTSGGNRGLVGTRS